MDLPQAARERPRLHGGLEAGTGAVHTAPGHGQDDYVVGQKYDLEILNPVGGNGVFLPENAVLSQQFDEELLGGVLTLHTKALTYKGRDQFVKETAQASSPKSADWQEKLYRPFEPAIWLAFFLGFAYEFLLNVF